MICSYPSLYYLTLCLSASPSLSLCSLVSPFLNLLMDLYSWAFPSQILSDLSLYSVVSSFLALWLVFHPCLSLFARVLWRIYSYQNPLRLGLELRLSPCRHLSTLGLWVAAVYFCPWRTVDLFHHLSGLDSLSLCWGV